MKPGLLFDSLTVHSNIYKIRIWSCRKTVWYYLQYEQNFFKETSQNFDLGFFIEMVISNGAYHMGYSWNINLTLFFEKKNFKMIILHKVLDVLGIFRPDFLKGNFQGNSDFGDYLETQISQKMVLLKGFRNVECLFYILQ